MSLSLGIVTYPADLAVDSVIAQSRGATPASKPIVNVVAIFLEKTLFLST